jgi:glutamyl-tRNA synthetase
VTVRLRFAPSPTGHLHVGGARTALYNWLYARSVGGTLILRSDDTDRARSTDEFARDIVDSLRWLGLDWDEGIEVGGPQGSYRQSERLERYREVARDMVDRGLAYHSFATPEELEAFRREAQAAGRPPAYDGRFRVDDGAAERRLAAGETAPIRFAVPRPGATEFTDVVRGDVTFDHVQVDDFVILRSDGTPTYHLASTVDDADFGITHVVRGEDLLSSTPKHILLTRAMGADVATYAHLPLLMGPDGTKLSKRHGHTAISAYRADGYLPEALRNYLAILSWSPGEDEELVPLGEMVERFRLDAVSRNPAVFDVTKLEWMNGVYLRELPVETFIEQISPLVVDDLGRDLGQGELDTLAEIAPLVQERAKRLTEVAPQVRFLFTDVEYDDTSWQKVMTKPEAATAVAAAASSLADLAPWDTASIEGALRAMLETHELSARKGLQPLRVAISGSSVSPPLFESMEALGRDRTLERLDAAEELLAAT